MIDPNNSGLKVASDSSGIKVLIEIIQGIESCVIA